MNTSTEEATVVCSSCFNDVGLKLDAVRIGQDIPGSCPNCGSTDGKKLPIAGLGALAHRYFVWGSMWRAKYGAAPLIQFNEHQSTSIDIKPWLEPDVRLIERLLGVGFFHYGPRLWMFGEIEPLKALQKQKSRQAIIDRIVSEYPDRKLSPRELFYRVRINPKEPGDGSQYDSPPPEHAGRGRLDSKGHPVLYGSPDLEVCIHECRVSTEDDVFVATLNTTQDLRLLDLSVLLKEPEHITEFESLDLTVHMLFLAAKHSYKLTRSIAEAARRAGFDGLVYPSYFSLLRLGQMPFQTVYGISHRRIEQFHEHEQAKTIPNLALFGRPIASGKVAVKCIDRLIINRVGYEYHFGPTGA
ncbi:RES family NAD+ phosphorylase [Candidatus Symbiobacter mobilis]|nr:RES family NAD+ phosphorylase [Candidatus Symbiobacter mobilis]